MKKSVLLSVFILAFGAAACSSTSGEDPLPLDEVDAGADQEDVLTLGDIGGSSEGDYRCGDAVINEWPLNDIVSNASVSVEDHDDFGELTVDAAAGGMQAAAGHPFVYVSLETGARVDITDLESLDDESWDLAFKRVAIRTNSGDSGPGGVELTKFSDTTLEEVTEVPGSDVPFRTDRSFDDDCEPQLDGIGNLFTAFNKLNPFNDSGSQSWYNYGSGGSGGVGPVDGDIYVLRRDEGSTHYKIQIVDWESGVYTIRWAKLEDE